MAHMPDYTSESNIQSLTPRLNIMKSESPKVKTRYFLKPMGDLNVKPALRITGYILPSFTQGD